MATDSRAVSANMVRGDQPIECYQVHGASDSIWLASKVKAYGRRLGFDAKREGALAIVVCELVTNAMKFGKRATVTVSALDLPCGIELCVVDDGPGFEDCEKAILDGYSEGAMRDVHNRSPRGLGLGLGAVSRLMHQLELSNRAPRGACVVARMWLAAPARPGF